MAMAAHQQPSAANVLSSLQFGCCSTVERCGVVVVCLLPTIRKMEYISQNEIGKNNNCVSIYEWEISMRGIFIRKMFGFV
jgi:hypothetical protein